MFSLRSLPTRRHRIFFFIFTSAVVLLTFSAYRLRSPPVVPHERQTLIYPPPNYSSIYEFERNLPQHKLDLPFPEGKTGRYVKFSNQVGGLGWNNVLNDLLMCAYLAYESNRTYVFQDYSWNPKYYPWQPASWPWQPASWSRPRTPLSALLSGPVAGGPWEVHDPAPRSISEVWFDEVCPLSERRIINTADVKPPIYWETGDVIFDHWKRLLRDAPEHCIEIVPADLSVDSFPQVFDLWLWSIRILPLWERFRDSPISRLLGSSSIVRSAVEHNEHLFQPRTRKRKPPSPFPRMMAAHIRRGDFGKACHNLANGNATYYSWNLLPDLPDSFTPPSGGVMDKNTPQNIALYLAHCWPSFDDIVKKISESRKAYLAASPAGASNVLDVMYILTNDRGEFLDRLMRTLRRDGWHTIVTSADLELDQEQIGVSMAVDMDIARQAAVFVGNGWSSFTSNIVHMRLVDGKHPISIRFW